MKVVKPVQTAKELLKELAESLTKLEEERIKDPKNRDIESVRILSLQHNGAGKMISLLGRQLKYRELRKEKPVIDFLNCH